MKKQNHKSSNQAPRTTKPSELAKTRGGIVNVLAAAALLDFTLGYIEGVEQANGTNKK